MDKFLFFICIFLFYGRSFAQIDMIDSTVQIVAFWTNKEKQTYSISSQKYKVKGLDTTRTEMITYEVDITIKDSTANSYTLEWFYKNFKVKAENPLVQKIGAMAQNLRVLIKTNELGVFQEVLNWMEVRDYLKTMTTKIKIEFKDVPKIEVVVDQVMAQFLSKESIESAAIQDVQQFYTFHGGKYRLGDEINAKMKVANLYGGEALDADVHVLLDEIDVASGNVVLRVWQTVDSKQLTDAAFEYLKKISTSMETKLPKRDEIPPMINNRSTLSMIHAESGWVVYTLENKEVTIDGDTTVEQRTIELK